MTEPLELGVEEALRVIAVHHLPTVATGTTSNRDGPIVVADPLGLVRVADSERLLGPLRAATSAGVVELGDEAEHLLSDRLRDMMQWCLRIEVRLLEISSWFEAAGVRHLVIKGPAVAHLDEFDPTMRSFGDLDLLVAGEDLDCAVATLREHGGTRPWPERRPGFDRRFAKSVTVTTSDGIEADLHRTLCDGAHGMRIPLSELFDAAEWFPLGARMVPALCRSHRLLHAAYHAILGSPAPRLSSLRDIAGYLTRPDLSPDDIVPIAAAWRGEAVLALAVCETLGAFPFEAPEWVDWAAGVATPAQEAAIVDRQRREGSSIGPAKVDLWRALASPRLKAAYAMGVAWPTHAHLDARGLRRTDIWRPLTLRRRLSSRSRT